MANELTCTSCNDRVTNQSGSVNFKCPKCNETQIVRCSHCRKIVARYTCAKCGMSGPN